MTGRPSKFSEELADYICQQLALGRSLRRICGEEKCPHMSTVLNWLQDRPAFSAKYARARELQAEVHADDIIDIADSTQLGEKTVTKADGGVEIHEGDMLEHRKLRISTRQWYAEKLRPKVYGAKQQIEMSGGLRINIAEGDDEELVQRLVELAATGRLKLPNGVVLEEGEGPDEDDDDIAGPIAQGEDDVDEDYDDIC